MGSRLYRIVSGKFLVLCLIVLGLGGCQQKPSKRPFNVLFVVVDDLRPELGCYGASHISSPNIDELASRSLIFDRAYCQAPICSPSRMSFLSGLRPHETGINDNNTPIREKLPDVITLPQHFKNQGYQTESYGKIFHQRIGDTVSWDYFQDGPRHRSAYQLPENTSINVVLDGSKRGRPYEAAEAPDSAYTGGIIANRALLALERFDKNKPFFLGVGFLKPHLPFLAPKKYWDLYEKPWQVYNTSNEAPEGAPEFALNKAGELRKYFGVPKKGTIPRDKGDTLLHGYYACISYMDAQVGKLLTALEEKGLKDNTIVVLFGDHGFKLGDFNDWCKDTHYELDTRVPLILHHPDKPAGRTSSITELIDLYPTLIEAAGVKKNSQSLSGTDLTPLFDKTNQKLKKAAFSQRPRKKVVGFSVRTENYRLVKWISKTNRDSTVAMELYDYTKSPIELKNVADDDDYLHIQEELSAMLADEIGI